MMVFNLTHPRRRPTETLEGHLRISVRLYVSRRG